LAEGVKLFEMGQKKKAKKRSSRVSGYTACPWKKEKDKVNDVRQEKKKKKKKKNVVTHPLGAKDETWEKGGGGGGGGRTKGTWGAGQDDAKQTGVHTKPASTMTERTKVG